MFLSLNIDFILADMYSADPHEMPDHAAFHPCIHCLPKYPFSGFWSTKVKQYASNHLPLPVVDGHQCCWHFKVV